VNPAGLNTGSYQGTVTLTPSSAAALPVIVNLTVTGAGAPVITPGGIVNASGYQTTLAPDTVFVIFGSNMGPATLAAGTAPSYPATLGGTSVTFTPAAGGSAITAKMVYTSAGQIAGLLPSSIAPGTYAVKVTYNSQVSAPQNVTVVARSFGIATSNSAGTGAAQATIGNVNGGLSLVRLTAGSLAFGGYNWTLTPAHPGDTLVIWGTGGGADPANDTGGTSGDQTAAGNFVVTVDGTAITPVYAGASSGYPGLWQINFTLPATIAADCFATLQVSAGGQLSNQTTVSIGAAGQTSCTTQIPTATLATLDAGGNIVMAGLTVAILNYQGASGPTSEQYVGGVFNRYTAGEFLIPYSGPTFGACRVVQETYPVNGKEPSAPDALLDAGTLTVTGPGLSQAVGVFQGPSGPAYNSTIAVQPGGTYTLKGAGGSQVGPFTATATMPSSFTVTNLSALSTVSRSQPLTVNWSGSGFDQVIVTVVGSVTSGTVSETIVNCPVSASLGSYSIPAAALAYLPAGTAQITIQAVVSQGGIVSAESSTSTALTPPLVAGGQANFGSFAGVIGYIVSATAQ
jgi:uncharacterized protein (TIGR03437 family)